MKKTIWLVLGGKTDFAKDYKDLAEIIKKQIELESNKDIEYEVAVIDDYVKVISELKTMAINIRPSRIIFTSSYRVRQAREIKKMYREIEIIVLAGIIPDDEVAIVPKSFLFQKGVRGLLYT